MENPTKTKDHETMFFFTKEKREKQHALLIHDGLNGIIGMKFVGAALYV